MRAAAVKEKWLLLLCTMYIVQGKKRPRGGMSPECKALEKAARFSKFLLKICFIEAGLRTSYLDSEELLDRAQSGNHAHRRPDLAYNTLHITTHATCAWVAWVVRVLRQNVKVVGNITAGKRQPARV